MFQTICPQSGAWSVAILVLLLKTDMTNNIKEMKPEVHRMILLRIQEGREWNDRWFGEEKEFIPADLPSERNANVDMSFRCCCCWVIARYVYMDGSRSLVLFFWIVAYYSRLPKSLGPPLLSYWQTSI